MSAIEQKVAPPRGGRGSNQSILRAMKVAEWIVDEKGEVVPKGDSYLCETRSKSNSFFSSARKMGKTLVRRAEDGGIRFWVVEKK